MSIAKEPVYIIIPVHNRKAITSQCLETLKKNGDLDQYYTVVVDDGSTDGTSEAITEQYPDVIILYGDGNLWWTGAIKKGMEYAYEQGAEYLIWLNDDCLVNNQTIARLLDFCRNDINSIIGSQAVDYTNQKIEFGGKQKIIIKYDFIFCPLNEIKSCDLLSGNLLCFHRNIIDKIGYPCSKFTPHYGGDSLFLMRAKNAGFKLFVYYNNDVNNTNGDSQMAPQRWLLKDEEPLYIIKLLFYPYSLYYWRMWLKLSQEEYGSVLGTLIFVPYYSVKFAFPVSLITILRFLPLSIRYKLSNLRQKIKFI
jgi:GT2 family glycosyltransferase